jgi:hypothetical protein
MIPWLLAIYASVLLCLAAVDGSKSCSVRLRYRGRYDRIDRNHSLSYRPQVLGVVPSAAAAAVLAEQLGGTTATRDRPPAPV